MYNQYKHTLTSPYAFMVYAFVLAFMPAMVYAEGSDFTSIIDSIETTLDGLIPILVLVALVVFFWGLIGYIMKADSPEGRSGAQQTMLWGIIALFVMVSVWGLVSLLAETLEVEKGGSINLPKPPSGGSGSGG